MDPDTTSAIAVLLVVLLIGCAPLLPLLAQARSRLVRALGALAWLGIVAAVAAGAVRYATPREAALRAPVTGRPLEVAEDGYVTSKECRSCHETAYASWHDSYHRRMTQVLTPETAQARIDGVELTHRGQTWRLFREGDEFFVEMDEPEWLAQRRRAPRPAGASRPRPEDARRIVRPLVMSTGSHHYEALWFSDGVTRKVSLLPFCWRIDQQRWLPVDAAFLLPPDEEQGSEGRWNIACNKCHATHARPRVSSRFDMQTDAVEFGIACESCHGPGERHVREYRDPTLRYARHFEADEGAPPDATITNPARLDPVRTSMVCGQCHAAVEVADASAQIAWNANGSSFRPGGDLHHERHLRDSGAEKFWPDGVIRTSGREYNGLVRSPCYTHGDVERGVMTCLSCHEMHQRRDDPRPREEWADDQLAPGMRGDLACMQCHLRFAAPAAIEAHTRHPAASAGSRCMDCHMPHVTYGLLTAMRSHTVASPTLAESLEVGRPNACNLCHLDRTLQWAGEKLAEWYAQPPPERARAGRGLTPDEREIAAGVLWITRGDAGLRALAACAMERDEVRATADSRWFAPFLAPLLEDPYAAVRLIAERCLTTLPGIGPLDYDFLAEPAARAAAAGRVRAAWERAVPAAQRPARASLLFHDTGTEAGTLDGAALRRLIAQRDDRRVVLAE